MPRLNVTSRFTYIQPLLTSQRNAAIIVVVFALLSSFAFMFMAVRTIRDVMALFLHRGHRPPRPPEILFFRTQLGHYAACLILSNVFISVAGLINLSWLLRSGLSPGSTCSAQAVLMQIGLWGTCWFTVAHGIHTLVALVFRLRQARWSSLATISIGWTVAFVAALLPMQKNVYGPAGISCGTTRSHPMELLFLGALPIILGAFISTAVYSVTFTVLHGKQYANGTRKLRALSTAHRRGEDAPEEYHRFITMIVWTMFWFPLAFVLLLAPSCVIHILRYAGYTVPLAPSTFAEACASMLGLVNVVLLCNTFRVISPMSRTAKVAAETVMTFGHDASGESPTAPHFKFRPQSAMPSHGRGHRTYNSTQTSSGHSQNSSVSSVDSSTGLISAEKKASYRSTKTKAIPLGLHIIPPAELGRQLDGRPSNNSNHGDKSQDVGDQFVVANSPFHTINLTPCPPRVAHLTEDTGRDSWKPDERHSFESMPDTGTFGKVTKKPSVASKAPLTSVVPLDAKDKSAMRPDSSKAVSSVQEPWRAPSSPMTHVPRLEVNHWRANNENRSNSRHLSNYSYATTRTLSTDLGSDYSGEIVHAYKIQPHSQFSQPDNDEGRDTVGSFPPRRSAWWRRMTRASVWSQETGYTVDVFPDEECQEAYWQVIGLFDPGPASDDQVGHPVGVTNKRTSKRATFARPQTLRIQPVKAMAKRSVQFLDTSKIKSFVAISVPNDSGV